MLLLVEFSNGDKIYGEFHAKDGNSRVGESFHIYNSEYLISMRNRLSFIGLKDANKWYSIDKMVCFMDINENELKSLERDEKINKII